MNDLNILTSVIAVAFLAGTSPVDATTLYTNEASSALAGDCSFTTACAAIFGRGDEFAAQSFSLTSAATVTGASFVFLGNPTIPNVNYAFYTDVGGLPGGPALSSGVGIALSEVLIGNIGGLDQYRAIFNVVATGLSAGSYFFAVQGVTTDSGDYLQQGLSPFGAAETNDGGLTWSAGYENGQYGEQVGGVAVALYGDLTVPEPASWALMLSGFAVTGLAIRRRRSVVATVVHSAATVI